MARLLALAPLSLLLGIACAPRPEAPAATGAANALPFEVLADTAMMLEMPAAPWPAEGLSVRATMVRVAPSRASLQPALPDAPPAAPTSAGRDERGGGLSFDDALQPPIARGPAPFVVTARGRGWIELDVRVDEQGSVSDAELHASAGADSAQVAAAVEAALTMRFHPALRRGEPVAVWSRQRFEIGRQR